MKVRQIKRVQLNPTPETSAFVWVELDLERGEVIKVGDELILAGKND
jgi:hypothetical protein